MGLKFHSDISDFISHAEPLLLENEAVNSLMLGLSAKHLTETMPLPVLATMHNGERVVSAAMQTPPFNLILTYAELPQLATLADCLWKRRATFHGVVGPSLAAKAFAELWRKRSGMSFRLAMEQRIYQLSQVIFPRETKGELRAARSEEIGLLVRWLEAFRLESLPREPRVPQRMRGLVEKRVLAQEFFVWSVEGKPVALAGIAGPTKNGVRINAVYTPKVQRRKGYASALVAQLSQRMLEGGRKFCFLYTDLSNPTSNGIYQRVGYLPVTDSRHYIFKAKE